MRGDCVIGLESSGASVVIRDRGKTCDWLLTHDHAKRRRNGTTSVRSDCVLAALPHHLSHLTLPFTPDSPASLPPLFFSFSFIFFFKSVNKTQYCPGRRQDVLLVAYFAALLLLVNNEGILFSPPAQIGRG